MTDVKKTPIPQRLKNVSNDHPFVAGAVDILDDRTGINQERVNESLQNGINALDSQNYVDAEATEQTSVVTEVLPTTGEANTLYRVAFWDGEQYNEAAYSEYTWDGEQYKLMSIKEPGIDDKPTRNSVNLVKSGSLWFNHSIMPLLREACVEDFDVVEGSSATEQYYYWNSDGTQAVKTATTISIDCYAPKPVEPGKVYKLRIRANDRQHMDDLLYTDAEYNIIERYNGIPDVISEFFTVAPVGAVYALITSPHATAARFGKLKYDINENIETITNCIVLHDFNTNKAYITSGDTVDVDNPDSNTALNCLAVTCTAGDKFTINAKSLDNVNYAAYAFLDSEGTILEKRPRAQYHVDNEVVTAPTNAAYLIVNNRKTFTDGYVIKGVASRILSEVKEDVDKLKEDVGNVALRTLMPWNDIQSHIVTGDVGEEISITEKLSYSHFLLSVVAGQSYDITVRIGYAASYSVYFTDSNDIIVSTAFKSNQYTSKSFSTCRVTVPEGATKMYVNSYAFINNRTNTGGTKAEILSFVDLQQQIDMLRDNEEGSEESNIPDYYFDDDYLDNVVNTIMEKREAVSTNSDSFFFITDYHFQTNEEHSLPIMKYIKARTGISKLINGGDNGGASPEVYRYLEATRCAQVYDKCGEVVQEFHGVLGNHEWNDGAHYNLSGVKGYFLERFKRVADGMDPISGSYYHDNKVNKIRYYFFQQTGGAAPITTETSNSLQWFGDSLLTVPEGYGVVYTAHHGYIPNAASRDECDADIDTTTNSHVQARKINKLLDAFNRHTSVTITISSRSVTFDYSSTNGYVIGVFCGHYHHGTLMTIDNEYNEEHVAVFRGSCDTLKAAAFGVNNHPWFWEDGIIGGTKIERTRRTIIEQCFYVVQIDVNNKKVYITAIGGDHDWEFDF